MSTHIVGVQPADEKWSEMKAVYDACTKAGIEVPDDVWMFFNENPPDDAGVIVDIEGTEAVSGYYADPNQGFEVDIRKLPKDICIVRFYNSY